MSKTTTIFKQREFRTFVFLVLLFVIVSVINPQFLSLQNLSQTLDSSLIYIVLAVGMTLVLLTGNIDISVGGTLVLSAAVAGTILKNGGNPIVAVVLSIVIGAVIGLINGIFVTRLKIPSFIMTLGMMEITRVLEDIYTNGQWVNNIPESFKRLSGERILGLNVFAMIIIIGVILVHLYLSKSRRGRYFTAIGDNPDGALSLGIPIKRYVSYSFMISGICASIAGLIFASQNGLVASNAGNGIEMTVIASAVLGGVSLSGGIGSVVGAGIGAIILTSINSALIYTKVPAFWNDTISGALLIIIVVTDAVLVRRATNRNKRARLNARVVQKEVSN